MARTLLGQLGHALDPKRNAEKDLPRAFLMMKYSIEYFFKLVGFFILICISFGLVMASCTEMIVLQLLPVLLSILLFLYAVMTTIGVPIYLLIGEIQNPWMRRPISYLFAAFLLYLAIDITWNIPLYDILQTYVTRVFPEALSCKNTIFKFS